MLNLERQNKLARQSK